ncbi:hypothetical protein GCM10019016_041380 [Streptomyces prasinosporus]|uniref:NUDIX hydrolase n=1 Tax=Streptomyces prasinosporus TaxID=68256 RepID=A0ABP6TRF0_9ACTN
MTIKDTPEEWEIRATETPFTGNKTSVRTDDVVMPDGTVVRRDYQVHPGSVAVLALDDADRVLVLRQYRHPVRHRLWEIPAGLLDVPRREPAARRPARAVRGGTRQGGGLAGADRRVHHAPAAATRPCGSSSPRGLSEAEGDRFEVEHEEADMELARVPRRRAGARGAGRRAAQQLPRGGRPLARRRAVRGRPGRAASGAGAVARASVRGLIPSGSAAHP